jgi:hypothetical protein
VDVPVGIEKVIYLAAREPAFREALRRDREAAVRERGLRLRPSELAMLRMATDRQLDEATAALDVSPGNLERRRFLQAVAASAAAAASASGIGGCGDDASAKDSGVKTDKGGGDTVRTDRTSFADTRGIQPDTRPPSDVGSDRARADASRPDRGRSDTVRTDAPPDMDTRGIKPDSAFLKEAGAGADTVRVDSHIPSYGIQPDSR